MNSLVLATGNPAKVDEIEPLLRQAGFKVSLQTEYFSEEVNEDGATFVENALKKARFASQKTGLPALADDSGLEVKALSGAPGICSARYSSQLSGRASEAENRAKVLSELGDIPYSQRQARYTCVVVYVESATDPVPVIGVGHWYGEILKAPRTEFGIGYDSIFWIPKLIRTASEISLATKLKISHRTMAIQQVLQQIANRDAQ